MEIRYILPIYVRFAIKDMENLVKWGRLSV